MKNDDHGVAGFFEDLPILVFVLAGTFTIVVSTLSVSTAVFSAERSVEMDRTADRCVEMLLSELRGRSEGVSAMVGSICSTRLHQVAGEYLEDKFFSMSVVMIHPELKWLLQINRTGPDQPGHASSSSRLFNAVTDEGLSAIMVVRVVVWQ